MEQKFFKKTVITMYIWLLLTSSHTFAAVLDYVDESLGLWANYKLYESLFYFLFWWRILVLIWAQQSNRCIAVDIHYVKDVAFCMERWGLFLSWDFIRLEALWAVRIQVRCWIAPRYHFNYQDPFPTVWTVWVSSNWRILSHWVCISLWLTKGETST